MHGVEQMIDCMLIGDSIAVGSHRFRKDCEMHAKGGITSKGWLDKFKDVDLNASTMIISLGTNDWDKGNTFLYLKQLREKVKAKQVFWIAPHPDSKPKALADVQKIAKIYNDVVITTRRYEVDKIHPNYDGYKELMNKTKQ